MAKASDNPFPSILVVEGSAPTTPASGDQRLFIDDTDHKLKRIDSAGSVTTVEGGSGGISTYARARAAANQAISTGTWTAINLGTVDLDTDSLHDGTTTSRFDIAVTGVYEFVGTACFAPASDTGIRAVAICKNGLPPTGVLAEVVFQNVNGINAVEIFPIVTGPVSLAAGDYVNLAVYQNSGTNVNATTNDGLGSWLGLKRLA